ncbi:hypothetical protein [Secundilactobacillus kimchicus]|uniref:hypothetical protein n=1 Tax=Secundilactobacillus kimchicus TaxID=528209 RepID=UPI000B13B39B
MKRERLAYAVVIIGLLMTIFVALMSGVDFYSPAEVWGAVTGQNNTAFNTVMMFRLPRILAALFVVACCQLPVPSVSRFFAINWRTPVF